MASDKKQYIAYKGDAFTIEWYFEDNGKSSAVSYFQELPKSQKIKLLYLFRMLGDIGKIRNEQKFRNEGDKMYAFKPTPDRFLCFFYEDEKVIITNAYMKKQISYQKEKKNEL